MNESRIFLCNGNYTRLTGSTLTTMTESEVKLFCQQNRGVILVFFQLTTEVVTAFLTQSDVRVKKINLAGNMDELMISKDRELNGCFDLVLTWLISIHPDGGFKGLIEQIRMR